MTTFEQLRDGLSEIYNIKKETMQDFLNWINGKILWEDLNLDPHIFAIKHFYFRWWFFKYRCSTIWEKIYDDSWVENIYLWFYCKYEKYVKDPRFERKMAKQRATWGFCQRDTWDIDYWMTKVLPDAIDYFADTFHGVPNAIGAWMYGCDPENFTQSDANISEEELNERYEWFKNYLHKAAHSLREANPETCSITNDNETIEKFHFEKVDGFPNAQRYVSDCSEEEKKQNQKYYEKELEIIRYRKQQFKMGLEMLIKTFGYLND